MKWPKYTSRQETIANLVLWVIIILLPVVGIAVMASVEESYQFKWIHVWRVVRPMLIILVAFLIHNYFIAPQLIYKHKHTRYAILLALLLVAFAAYQFTKVPPPRPLVLPDGPDGRAVVDNRPPIPFSAQPNHPTHEVRNRPLDKPLASPHDFTMISLLLFALGANLGIKLYFKTQQEQKYLVELEKENLRQELTYLRYQVNPHFLMNTLNNIHALVDIDPDKAKSSIVQLSKFMRYLLYESDKEYITLQQVVNLTHHYVGLVRQRYSDKVDIQLKTPETIPNVNIAPLLIIPFIENAFKHGISYDKPSFVHMNLSVIEGGKPRVKFVCRNSKNNLKYANGGVGMPNVVKRLDLIYGDQYMLDINEDDEVYEVVLVVPTIEVNSTSNVQTTKK